MGKYGPSTESRVNVVLESVRCSLVLRFSFKEMISVVRNMSQQDFSQDDVFICVIMSHGYKGKVLGVDMSTVEVETVKKIISDVESLAGKPKIFFIAACQGGKLNSLYRSN